MRETESVRERHVLHQTFTQTATKTSNTKHHRYRCCQRMSENKTYINGADTNGHAQINKHTLNIVFETIIYFLFLLFSLNSIYKYTYCHRCRCRRCWGFLFFFYFFFFFSLKYIFQKIIKKKPELDWAKHVAYTIQLIKTNTKRNVKQK